MIIRRNWLFFKNNNNLVTLANSYEAATKSVTENRIDYFLTSIARLYVSEIFGRQKFGLVGADQAIKFGLYWHFRENINFLIDAHGNQDNFFS